METNIEKVDKTNKICSDFCKLQSSNEKLKKQITHNSLVFQKKLNGILELLYSPIKKTDKTDKFTKVITFENGSKMSYNCKEISNFKLIGDNSIEKALKDFANEIKKHYKFSPSVRKTIDKELTNCIKKYTLKSKKEIKDELVEND